MSAKHPAKAYSAYRVTASTDPAMPVGSILIDKGVLLRRDWTLMNTETGAETWAVGKRVGRLCVICRTAHHHAAAIGHAGPCGPNSPKLIPDDAV